LGHHGLDAVTVVDEGIAEGFVEEGQDVEVGGASDGNDGVNVSKAGELDGEEAERGGGAIDD